MISLAYRAATDLAAPLLRRHLAARVAGGKEEAGRLGERFGIAGLARPAGRLGWLHAASVGETQSLLPLIGALAAREPGLTLLLTTGTVTSARLVALRRPPATLHQYLPLDRRIWVERFLDHWRPDFALWTESELWPNLLSAARARGLPMALVNGRMSARSLARWRWAGALVRPALAGFSVALAQDAVQATRLAVLGARDPQALGNLKFAADPLPADETELAALRRRIAGRPLWLAASTHPGEEAIVGAAHRALARARPGLLTIIVPRHAERGPAIAAELAGAGLAVARRAAGGAIGDATDIYLADSMGELGLFYRLAPVALVAGSYRWQGHNPIEPAQLGAAVLSGPQVASFQEIYDRMTAAEAALIVSEDGLAPAVDRMLGDGGAAGRRARAFAGNEAAGILQRILLALEPVIGPRGDASA